MLRRSCFATTSASINERLKRDGMRTIRLDDAELVGRYGLEALASEAGHFQQ